MALDHEKQERVELPKRAGQLNQFKQECDAEQQSAIAAVTLSGKESHDESRELSAANPSKLRRGWRRHQHSPLTLSVSQLTTSVSHDHSDTVIADIAVTTKPPLNQLADTIVAIIVSEFYEPKRPGSLLDPAIKNGASYLREATSFEVNVGKWRLVPVQFTLGSLWHAHERHGGAPSVAIYDDANHLDHESSGITQ